MNKLCIGLLLSISLSCTQVKPYFTFMQNKAGVQAQKDTLLAAIDNLHLAQVEQAIKEHGVFEQAHKLKLIDAIEEKIAELKKQQNSLRKYLNPQLALGALATGLAASYFTKGISTSHIDNTARTTYQELKREFDRVAPTLTQPEQIILAQAYSLEHNDALWRKGLNRGTISTLLAAIGVKQLYNGLTTQNLKDKYKKALAIRTLLLDVPTE